MAAAVSAKLGMAAASSWKTVPAAAGATAFTRMVNRPLGRGGPGQAADGLLGEVVVRVQPGPGLGVDREEVDDPAAALVTHYGEGRLHRPPSRPQAARQRLPEHLVGLLLEKDVRGKGDGVVDEHVEPADLVHRRRDGAQYLRLVPDIGLDEQPAAAELEQQVGSRLAGRSSGADPHRAGLI